MICARHQAACEFEQRSSSCLQQVVRSASLDPFNFSPPDPQYIGHITLVHPLKSPSSEVFPCHPRSAPSRDTTTTHLYSEVVRARSPCTQDVQIRTSLAAVYTTMISNPSPLSRTWQTTRGPYSPGWWGIRALGEVAGHGGTTSG